MALGDAQGVVGALRVILHLEIHELDADLGACEGLEKIRYEIR
jgi:hypothetical protein